MWTLALMGGERVAIKALMREEKVKERDVGGRRQRKARCSGEGWCN